ncbi:hypothetical protein D3C84_1021790 [compost metagenome]
MFPPESPEMDAKISGTAHNLLKIVNSVSGDIQVFKPNSLTEICLTPDVRFVKILLIWKLTPSILYSYPVPKSGFEIDIVP